MFDASIVLNEREAREARAMLAEIDSALTSEKNFESIVVGLPLEAVNGYRRALTTQRSEVQALLNAYEQARSGEFSELTKRAGNDLGLSLVIGRIVRGYSQKELARRLGLKEQQIQRYEAEKYRSISLSNFKRVAQALGIILESKIPAADQFSRGGRPVLVSDYKAEEVRKIIKHARDHNWFEIEDKSPGREEDSYSYLQRYVSDHLLNYGSPSLLRTGLNVEDLSDDLALIAWKARVTRVAESVIQEKKPVYSGLAISWLNDLVRLSQVGDGPLRAKDFLLDRGIVVVVEPQIPGLKLDGAAFLINGVPVIGLTLRRDSLDSFWFTLLHEISHVVLHYRMGLAIGFFDDTERVEVDEIEEEANRFASNVLIPNELWKRTPARISKANESIEKFAREIRVHPAIVFGRVQKERGDYATFSDKIGRGMVRKWLL